MTQKEQLIDLLDKSDWAVKEIPNAGLDDFVQKLNDWLADYLLENGVIVPPCKVGDVLYYMLNDGTIQDRTVDEIALNKHGLSIWAGIALVEQNQLGQSVFLTREAAEQALKEREKSET